MEINQKFNNGVNTNIGEASLNPVFQFATDEQAMALLALSHSKLEHLLYEIMYEDTRNSKTKIGEFSPRYLMDRSKIYSYSRIYRARHGLTTKMSIELQTVVSSARPLVIFTVYSPTEVFERRQLAGVSSQSRSAWDEELADSPLLDIVERIIEKKSLSRREAQVVLRCAEGMTNAEIGEKLFIHEETVKFHLHNIFMKFGVRRRTELVAHLYRH